MRLILLTCLALTTTAHAGSATAQQPMPGAPRGDVGPDRRGPVRGKLFVSPMGEPVRAEANGVDPETRWFETADTNHDGILTPAEFTADAMRFFAVLDRGHDGEIDPDDIEVYESELLPEVRVGGGPGGGGGPRGGGGGGRGGGRRGGGMGGGGMGGGGMDGGGMGGGGMGGPPGGGGGEGSDSEAARPMRQPDNSKAGAARYGLFDYPEPITPMDTNFNRGISPAEFEAAADKRFAMLDSAHAGVLRLKDLPRVSAESFARPHPPGGPRPGGPRPVRDDE
ncbi:EF-hand domain-containing protein [Sphingomonas sp. UYP23]